MDRDWTVLGVVELPQLTTKYMACCLLPVSIVITSTSTIFAFTITPSMNLRESLKQWRKKTRDAAALKAPNNHNCAYLRLTCRHTS